MHTPWAGPPFVLPDRCPRLSPLEASQPHGALPQRSPARWGRAGWPEQAWDMGRWGSCWSYQRGPGTLPGTMPSHLAGHGNLERHLRHGCCCCCCCYFWPALLEKTPADRTERSGSGGGGTPAAVDAVHVPMWPAAIRRQIIPGAGLQGWAAGPCSLTCS